MAEQRTAASTSTSAASTSTSSREPAVNTAPVSFVPRVLQTKRQKTQTQAVEWPVVDPGQGGRGRGLEWWTLPGLFAGGGFDIMTRMLLSVAPLVPPRACPSTALTPPYPATVLDFCCGSGAIAAAVWLQHHRSSARGPSGQGDLALHLSDADAVAVEAARWNLEAATMTTVASGGMGWAGTGTGFPGKVGSSAKTKAECRCHVSDGFQRLDSDLTFDLILSNPPVHFGRVKHDLSVVEVLLREGHRRLRPGGGVWFVTQELIPVRGLVARLGLDPYAEVAFTDGRFVVWHVSQAPLATPGAASLASEGGEGRGKKKRKKQRASSKTTNARKRKAKKKKRSAGAD